VSQIAYFSTKKIITADNVGLIYSRTNNKLKRPHARPLGTFGGFMQKRKRQEDDQLMYSQPKRSIKTKENDIPSQYTTKLQQHQTELNSSSIS